MENTCSPGLTRHVSTDYRSSCHTWTLMTGCGCGENLTEGTRPYRARHILGRRFLAEPATLQSVDSMVRDSSTFEEFRSALEAEIDTLTRLALHSDKHRLDQRFVGTFSGRESLIPQHVLTILRNLSGVKVLNVTDDRRPIGRDEAQKLLNLKMQRGWTGASAKDSGNCFFFAWGSNRRVLWRTGSSYRRAVGRVGCG